MNAQIFRSIGALLAVSALLAACSQKSEPTVTVSPPAAAPAAAPVAPPPVDFSGVWQAENQDVLKTVDGSPIPFKPEAEKTYKAYQTAAKKRDFSWDTARRCIPPGVPRLMAISQPFAIAQDANMLTLTFQYQRLYRFIYLNDMYPTNADATFEGESHGHWDGKVLVIETKKFKIGTILDSTGIPHGPNLEITERLEMTAPDTVVDHVTVKDDDTFTQTWQADIVLKKQSGVQIQEDVCVERQGIHK